MSQFGGPSYDVARPSGQCAFTGRTLEPNEAYIATLVEEGEALRRLDISMEAWEAGQRPDHLFSYWKTVVPEPGEKKKKLFVDDQALMNLLRRLADAEQPQRIAFRFVLGLILMRKKLLRYDGNALRTTTDKQGQQIEQTWWQMTPKVDVTKGPQSKWDESETIEILDPRLNDEQIQQVTEQLSEILQAEL